ncbi:choline-sulfatase, partial [Aureobasidium melanogenum]
MTLPVPTLEPALGQGRPDQPALTLAGEDVLSDFFKVPFLVGFILKGLEDSLRFRVLARSQVDEFLRILAQVEQLGSFTHVFGENSVVTAASTIQMRQQGQAVHWQTRNKFRSDQLHKSGHKIQGGHVLGNPNFKQLTNAVIDIAHSTVVCPACAFDLLVSKVVALKLADVSETLAVRILFFWFEADIGKVNVHALVQVPILVLNGIRVVRHLFVIIKLICSHTWPGLQNRATVVVPLQSAVGVVPVHRPAIVARINIRSQSVLIPMQLISDKMHFASQCGFVACLSQVMRVGRGLGRNGAGIVVGADLGGELSANQAHARRSAQWRVAPFGGDTGGESGNGL